MKNLITYTENKAKSPTSILWLMMLLLVSITGLGQVSYRVGLDPDNKTYRLYMKSVASYTGVQAKISTAQMTLLVPHNTGNQYFQPSNIKGKIVGINQMTWNVSRFDSPTENQPMDYISFGFSGSGSPIIFDINANEEIELLSFENVGVCNGSVSLISTSDPFLPPNSKNANPGNQITILGHGISNAYASNYGGSVNCQTLFPDLKVGITGNSNITAEISTNYTLTVSNIGSAASNGEINLSTTLPVGVNYNSFTGAGWSIIPTIQPNGTTIISAVSNSSAAINGSLTPLILNVTASASIGNGSLILISSTVAGGGDSNADNNTANINSTVTVNSPNLSLVMTGPSTINPNGSANYSLNIANVGNAVSVGSITASIILPNGLSYNSFTGNGWVYGSSTLQNGGAILLTFTNANLINANTSANALVINLTAGNNTTNNMVLPVVGTVSGGGDITNNNNVSSVNTTIVAGSSPILGLTINGSGSIIAGSSSSFTINVNNTGLAPTVGSITTTSILPSGFIYNSFTGAGWNVVAAAQSNGTTLLTATYSGIIGAGGLATPLIINYITQLSLGTGASYTITNTLTGGGTIGSISANYNVIIVAPANLSLVINGINNISAGSTGNYVFTLSNNSSTASSGIITNTITLPAGVNYNSFTGNGWNFVSSVPQQNGSTLVTFSYNNIIAGNGSASSLALNLSFANNLVLNSSLIINSSITGIGINANSNITLLVISAPITDLTVNIKGTATTNPNGTAVYTITVNNIGSAPSSGPINVSVLIPNGLSYTSFTGSGWNYSSSTLQTGGAILVTFTTNTIIAAGGSNNNLVINLTAGGSLANNTTLTITGNISGGGESNISNNTSSTNLTIFLLGNPLLIATINGATTVNVNLAYDYTINVNNIGSSATSGASTVSTILPAGIIYNSTSSNGWTSIAIPQSNGTTLIVSSYTGIIPQNGNANPLIINITPSGIFPSGSTFTINGSVSGGGASNTGNNTFFTNITINNSISTADLGVTVSLDNKIPNLGQIVNYTFSITNNGNGTPNNVQTLITLPAGFIVTNFGTTNGGYNINTGIWNVGTLSTGQTFTLTISGYANIEGIDFAVITLINTSLQDTLSFNNTTKICYATPVSICNGEGYIAYLGEQNTNIQWFKNGVQINDANADSLFITTTGAYSASYTNTCGELIITPAITVINGVLPNAPTIITNKTGICGNETAQLSASSCGLGKIIWSNGATTSTISVNTNGTYTATCNSACGASLASNQLIISTNCQNIGQIGNFVWYDNNNNGKQDAGELGVKNVRLELYKDGVFTGSTTTTDSTGKYLFSNLSSGNYQVKILPISFPENYLLSRKPNAVGVSNELDSDFSTSTGLSQIITINTAISSQAINLTIDGGIYLKPEITISDPCKCFGVEYKLTEKKELYETVTVNGPSNDTWTIIQQTGMLALDTLVKRPVLLGSQLIEVSAGKYQINFTHEDNVGYSLKVTNGSDTLSISNFCSIYPTLTVTTFEQTICKNAAPIPLTATMSLPGTAQFYYIDKTTQQKVVITEFDPKKFTSGETIYIKIDVTPADSRLCTYIIVQTVQISVLDCNLNCKPVICVPLIVSKTKN
ncbi:MAG: SdrD B-like domain-containing protein [Emticicia sp.]|nr:SdrD B-like domain-containing protein [Emticicia sp.]